jgi:hypothetical protein
MDVGKRNRDSHWSLINALTFLAEIGHIFSRYAFSPKGLKRDGTH